MMFSVPNLDHVVTQKEEQLTKNNSLRTKLKNAYLAPGNTSFIYEELNKNIGLLMFTKPLIMQAITMLESRLTYIERKYSDPAFNTATGISAFLPVSRVINYDTDEMVWAKTKGFLSTSHNIPYHKDMPVIYENYSEHVIEGYTNTYKLLLEQKTLLLSSEHCLQNFICLPARYVVRATQYYKQLLSVWRCPLL